ncbi:MAG: endonuclease III [Paludibacteraceae bacterium]|nr:endonuclease III [Paludibacteraceae bacterium]
MNDKERYAKVMGWFQENMPNAKSELNFSSPFELLVAVMLSAQCTDARVNIVTPTLFAAYPDAFSMAKASEKDIYELVKSISYPNSKAKHLLEASRKLVCDFGGVVPSTMEELTSLPGVGRKTANVMMAVAFGKPAMPVDTHVFRVSQRIGFTPNSRTPEETEKILTANLPQNILSDAHHWLLLHGRYVCTAKKPKCKECGIKTWCAAYMQA